MLPHQISVCTIHRKTLKKKNKFKKNHLQHGVKILIYLIDRILFQILKIILRVLKKDMKQQLIIHQ